MNPPPRRPEDEPPPRPAPPPDRDPLLDDPLFAELVDAPAGRPVEDLPVAEPVAPPEPRPLPRAEPVRAAPVRAEPVARRKSADPEPLPPEGRSRPVTACAVIGCFGVVVLAAVGFLLYAAVVVLNHLGDTITDHDGHSGNTPAWVRPGPVTQTKLAANTSKTLPAPFDAVGRGAGGRYLFLRIPTRGLLAVFDPNEGDLVKVLEIGDRNFLFAGGAAKLFVYKPGMGPTGAIERYDLTTWKLETAAPGPAGVRPSSVDALVVGAGSDGPVYLLSAGPDRPADVRVLNAEKLTQMQQYSVPEWKAPAGGRVHARASNDGSVVAVAGATGAIALRFGADGTFQRAIPLRTDDAPNPALATPSPDAVPLQKQSPEEHLLYTPRGIFRSEGTRIARPDGDYFFTLPADHGNAVYLSLDVTNGGKLEGPLRLHFPGPSRRTVGTLAGVPVPTRGLNAGDTGDVPPDQRVHLWPAAGLVAVLPNTNDRLELFKVDVKAALRGNYVVIASDPPTTAYDGTEWRYTPEVWTPRGRGVLWEVVRGPQGLQTSGGPGGETTFKWTPHGNAGPVEVHIRATDPDDPKLTAEQKFRLIVTDE